MSEVSSNRVYSFQLNAIRAEVITQLFADSAHPFATAQYQYFWHHMKHLCM
jgi:hypothetical protein